MPEKRWFVVDSEWHEATFEPPIECESREHAQAVLAMLGSAESASEMIRWQSHEPWLEKAIKYPERSRWSERGRGHPVSVVFLRYLGLMP
jgi:hypothetical protein